MWNATFCVSWLKERYEEVDSMEVSASSLRERYRQDGGSLQNNILAKYLSSLYKVRSIKHYDAVACHQNLFYSGISEKCTSASTSTDNFENIKHWIPSTCFVSDLQENAAHISILCPLTVNGNNVVKKVIFNRNGNWELYISDKLINLQELQIQNTFNASKQCIQDVCSIAFKLQLCCGKEKENIDNIDISRHQTEFLGTNKTKIFRSKICKRAVPFLSMGSTCKNCNTFKRKLPLEAQKSKIPKVKSSEKKVSRNFQKSNESEINTDIPPIHQPDTNAAGSSTDDQQMIVLKEKDNSDMSDILEKVMPNAPPQMLKMLEDQKQNLAKDPRGRRWDKTTIRLCLALWSRSKQNYQILKDSKILILPSKETLRVYKNSIDQKAGFQKEVFEWMVHVAKDNNSPNGIMKGGILIDEMSIQEDLCMVQKNGEISLVGFVQMGDEADYFEKMCSGKLEKRLATHVLQFLYLGLNGFRFPFACFPVTQTKPCDLHVLFWRAVQFLNVYGFQVLFVSMDGAQTNREFMKMFFKDSSPVDEDFSTQNIWFPKHPPIIFIMDYSHVIKRIRNNILKSGYNKSNTRHLQFKTNIVWDHWIKAFKWDRETNSFPLHYKLTDDHLFLNQESKMRNKLAEDVLSSEMLNLMQSFKTYLGDTGDELEDSINLLKSTSKMVSIFRDMRPITDREDVRLDELNTALKWFVDWENCILNAKNTSSVNKEKMLLSHQTREDIKSCITGLTKLCKLTLEHDRISIVPARINSDAIENIFCQQRGIVNGNNTNPTFYQFAKNTNTIILGESALSKTCNTSNSKLTPMPMTSNVFKSKKKETPLRKPLVSINDSQTAH